MSILHIIESFWHGGATRAVIAMIRDSIAEKGPSHSLVGLRAEQAMDAFVNDRMPIGVESYQAPSRDSLAHLIERHDVVVIHFWNNPEVLSFLSKRWPKCRLVIWYHIFGGNAPQVISPEIAKCGDFQITCCSRTLSEVSGIDNSHVSVIPPGTDLTRLNGFRPRHHEKFTVGYIGTVGYHKLHPDFLSMSLSADIPEAEFHLCGLDHNPALNATLVSEPSWAERVKIRPASENISDLLADFDVLGYPVAPHAYACSELVIQEAMYCGIPPIVFPEGGIPDLVQHRFSGLIVNTANEYSRALEELHRNSELRSELGHNAASYARRHFGSKRTAKAFHEILPRIFEKPKQIQNPIYTPTVADAPARLFMRALGCDGKVFARSLDSQDPLEAYAADRAIMELPDIFFLSGLRAFLETHKNDAWLIFWKGLFHLRDQNSHKVAFYTFVEALENGFPSVRIFGYLNWLSHRLSEQKDVQMLISVLRRLLKSWPLAPAESKSKFPDFVEVPTKWGHRALNVTKDIAAEVIREFEWVLAEGLKRAGTRQLLIWDSGSFGQTVGRYLDDYSIPYGYLDRDERKQGCLVKGHRIHDPNDLSATLRPFILVCSRYASQIILKLRVQGFQEHEDFRVIDEKYRTFINR